MTKSRRIILFIFGIILGSILVYFTLIKDRNRGEWLPENRIKNKIQNSEIVFSHHALCMMACRDISQEVVLDILKSGNVNFSESNIHESPCPSYAIDAASSDTKQIRVIVTTIDSISEIETAIDLSSKTKDCNCK